MTIRFPTPSGVNIPPPADQHEGVAPAPSQARGASGPHAAAPGKPAAAGKPAARTAQGHPALNGTSASSGANVPRQTNAGFEAAFRKEDFKVLPNEVHMIWLGSKPGAAQMKYVKNWAEKNPGAKINIWTDSKHLGAYAENQAIGKQISELFPDGKAFQAEKAFRGLFSQLHVSMKQPHSHANLTALHLSLNELNKELSKKGNAELKQKLLAKGGKVTAENAAAVMRAYAEMTKGNDEKFLLADRLILDQTVKAWDRAQVADVPSGQDNPELQAIQKELSAMVSSGNAFVRDLSDPKDMPAFTNRDAYVHGIVGRKGAYPEASDVARYEILNNFGGTYTDVDLECVSKLEGLKAHPDLMLVGIEDASREGPSGEGNHYFQNGLLSSHPGSTTVKGMVDNITEVYKKLSTKEFNGTRYFDRPNKSMIEQTGPAGLRAHVDQTIRSANGQPARAVDAQARASYMWSRDQPENDAFWSAVHSHIAFPEGHVNFETEEQLQSATKDSATFDGGFVGKAAQA